MATPRLNLYTPATKGYEIYQDRRHNWKYIACKVFPNKKKKCANFYSVQEAKEYLDSLPETHEELIADLEKQGLYWLQPQCWGEGLGQPEALDQYRSYHGSS